MKELPSTWKAVFRDDSWLILDDKNKIICKVASGQNAEANARLIASAPYMRGGLKSVSELIGDEDLPDNGELSGAAICDMVRSAVESSS